MAKGKDYRITAGQGQFLLGMILGWRTMPEKLGESKKFSPVERAAADRDVLVLYDEIKKVSPLMRRQSKERGNMFGPEENWDLKKTADGSMKSGDMLDESLEVPLHLTEKAVSGAMWLILFACHPESAFPRAATNTVADILQPLAFRLRRLAALEDELGLRNAKSREWPEDDSEEELHALAAPEAPAAEKETTVLKKEKEATPA